MRKDPPLWGRRGELPTCTPQRSQGPNPGSLAPFPVTALTPEAGPTPTAGPGVDPTATATPQGAAAGVGGGVEEGGLALVAAHIEVTGVTVGHTVEVILEVAHIIAAGDPGQTPMTAIPVAVGA